MNTPILIPAFRPGPELIGVVEQLVKARVPAIVIVDNGNGSESRPIFEYCATLPNVRIVRRDVNIGKGAGLKTGIAYILRAFPASAGLVTADADGQHHPDDILRVARSLEQNPDCLILGCRQFDRGVPLRSRFGNICTRALTRAIIGRRVQDSQTGLRGIPRKLLPYLLSLPSNAYEFELDMLIASKHLGIDIVEERIQTIYEPGNPTSHFDPLRDSMRIYFVLFRFSLLSLLTAALDNLVFVFAYQATASVLASQVMSRSIAVLFNYPAARKAVFLSHERHRVLLPKYILLVAASGAASYGLIHLLTRFFGFELILAKLTAESLLFIASFVLQRDFVFTRRPQTAATDWNQYYRSVPFTARLARKYIARVLLAALREFPNSAGGGVIIELGGANSCFLDRIVRELEPSAYHIVDNNDYGLNILSQRAGKPPQVRLHSLDVLSMNLNLHADTVFSIGLIEHFNPADTRTAVRKHFELLRPGGYAILSFPMPTPLYRWARRVMEFFGIWNFPDERPLSRQEVLESVAPLGDVVLEKTLWPKVYTQHLLVVRKRALPLEAAVSA
jgi:putative flippase GtrA